MAQNGINVAAHLTEAYKGIEGFYVLNRSGDLGYFSADGRSLARETFAGHEGGTPATNGDEFRAALRHSVGEAPPGKDKELGYLLPVDGERVWNTATLVLHEHVAKELMDALDRAIKQGRMSLAEGDRRFRDMDVERGLHRGFEDLLNHTGSFGSHTFFPVLYIRPVDGDPEEPVAHPVRVVNLLWLITATGKFTDILALMRENLTTRGALNRGSRVEHRFTLQGEDD